MKTYALTILFGIALVQALPTLKSVKLQSESKDWLNEKKFLTKFDDESLNIKPGNRTKKSVVCLDTALLNNGDCPPGCGEQHQGPETIDTYQVPQQYPVMIPNMASTPVIQSQPSHQSMTPSGVQPSITYQFLPQSEGMIPSIPQSPSTQQFMPSPPVMVQQAPQRPSVQQFGPSPPVMVQQVPQRPSVQQFVPSPPAMVQHAPQPMSMQQYVPPPPMMMPVPEVPLMIPSPLRPPEIVGPISQLPPCPPEQQFVIPGTESGEITTYEFVPVRHHISSSPAQVITTQKPPYACIPAGQSQSLPQPPSAASVTTVQQQSVSNQVQVLQGNSYPISSGNQQYLPPSGNQQYLPPSGNQQYLPPSGNQQYLPPSENVHMIQIPPSNPSYHYQPPQLSGPAYYPQQPLSYSSTNQYIGQPAVYHQPTVTMSSPDCVQVSPIQNGGFGYQASQSVAQSYAAAQSAAYNSYGSPLFRSAADSDGESGVVMVAAVNSTIPLRNSNNHGLVAPSARYSSHGVIQRLPRGGLSENGQVKRESPKKGIEKNVKA